MTTLIKTHHGRAYADDLARNWAAEYARRLYDELLNLYKADVAKLESKQTEHESKQTELEGKQTEHESKQTELEGKQAALEHKHAVDIAWFNSEMRRVAADAAAAQATADSKLAAVPVAAPGAVGGIKPLTDGSGTVNRSGLVIGEDGTAYISTKANGGISRDGAGQLHIRCEESEDNLLHTGVAGAVVSSVRHIDHLFDVDAYTYGSALDAHLYADLHTYTTKPQRIGTWVDGTPIWRMAFVFEMESYKREIYLDDKIGFKDWFLAMFINGSAVQTTQNEIGGDSVKVDAHFCLYPNQEGYEVASMNMIRGWVEFATPESNIGQCYTGAWTESLNHKSSLNSVQSMYTSYSTNSNVSYNQYGPSQTVCMQVTGGSSTAATGIKLDISDLFSDGDWIRAEFKIQVTGSPDTIQAFVTDGSQKTVLAKRGSGSMPTGEWINYTTDAAKVVSENGKIYFCVSNTCGYWYITDIVLYKLGT